MISLLKNEDVDRGTGRTTKQVKEAPYNAIYVWCNNNDLRYVRAIAYQFGRYDLKLKSHGWLDHEHVIACQVPIVVDHAARVDPALAVLITTRNAMHRK